MTKKYLFGSLLLFTMGMSFGSCSDDDDVKDPSDTISLNMLNEDNGKTLLGTSDVYINRSNNFKTSSSYLTDIGPTSGVGVKTEPQINNLAQEVAVTPGHLYQIFDKETLRDFPSGKRAVQIEAAYYKAYVVSPIVNNTLTTGGVIKYILAYPDTKGLPEYGHNIGNLNYPGDNIEFVLPKEVEYVFEEHWGSEEDGAFNVQATNGKLNITLLKSSNNAYGPYGTYKIYVRLENIFSVVKVNVGI